MNRAIILIRHGRPDLPHKAPPLPEYLDTYDQATIDMSLPPPEALLALTRFIDVWFCSPLPRARHSLEMVSPHARPLFDDLFKEAPLPRRPKPTFVPLPIWLAYLRGRWMQGRIAASEPIEECLARSQKAVDTMLSSIPDDTEGALMGHGFFNHLLAQALMDRGWRRAASGRGFWSVHHLIEARF